MGDYVITVSRSAEKEMERLPQTVLRRVANKVDKLADQPRPSGCVKLQAARNRWRIRIGDYRVLYAVDDRARNVDIIAVRHRRFVYE